MSEGPISASDPAAGRASSFAAVRALAVAGGVALAAGGLLSCGDSSTEPGAPPPPPPPPPVATTVAVTPAAAQLSAIGETVQLSAEVRDQGGRAMAGAAVTWTSSDPAVVSVSASGLATAAGNGTVTVTAASGSASGIARVVVAVPAASVVVAPDTVAMSALGDTVRLVAEVRDAAGRPLGGAGVAWVSDDTLVATVDSTGLVSAAGNGAATIRATSGEVSAAASVLVAQSVGSLTVSPPEEVIGPGDTLRLEALAVDANGHAVEEAEITWSSSNPSVADVDASGTVRGIRRGAATITAASDTARATSRITVGSPDRSALEALYDATDGPNWTNSENWLTDAPLDDWYGVDTDAAGRVVRVQLQENALSGELPPDLRRLARLETLELGYNQLTGRIPPELGGLTNLKYLTVRANELRRWIPPELGGLASLERLDLSDNSLTSRIPPELGALVNLRELQLHYNQLTGPIPPALGTLRSLRTLLLWSNRLTGPIPPELGGLTNLVTLYLQRNQLTGPIPPEFGGLANLSALFIYNNELTGTIPPELGSLTNLGYLVLGDNQLRGWVPPELGDLANLAVLRLEGNQLTGSLPPELGRLANLAVLRLEGNQLTGSLPPELGGLAKLTQLGLERNQLTGPIPSELGDLAKLEVLSLDRNDLEGVIPHELGGMKSLREMALSGNSQLRGELPVSLTGLRLEVLTAGDTDLCVPAEPTFDAWVETIEKLRVARCGADAVMMYLTQAVQSRTHPVPLVAGEPALLRAFVTANQATAEGLPPVRFRFYLDGSEVIVNTEGSSVPIPTSVAESNLFGSAFTLVPGEMVKPGLEVVAEVDPGNTLDPALGVAERIPAEGRLGVDVRDVPVLHLTVIPFSTAENDVEIIREVDAMAADPGGNDLLEFPRRLLPVGELDVRAHEPVITTRNSAFEVYQRTKAIRVLEGGVGHYMGVLQGRSTDAAGVGQTPGWVSSVAMDLIGEARRSTSHTIAHELGHNMSLLHAPCGDPHPLSVDPGYPHSDGSIGAWGYDLRTVELVPPDTDDLMGYCFDVWDDPDWVSDYHFSNALRHRLRTEGPAASSVAAVPTRSLLVWGGVDRNGEAFLDPAFVVDAPVALPDSAGAYAVTGRDAGGGELFSLSFAMPVVADAEGASSFVFAVPAEAAWEGRLASVTLSGPAGEVVLDGETNRPMAILRDPASGQVRGFFSELSQDVGTAAAAAVAIEAEPGLRVLFSRGIPDAAAWRR